MNAHISTIMEREVSRKEFLGMSGLAVASIFGFGTVIKMLTGKSLTHGHSPLTRGTGTTYGHGYGASAYGK